MKNIFTFLFLSVFLSAYGQSKVMSDETVIRKNVAAFSQALMDGEFEKVVQSYTEDAKLFPKNMDIQKGTEAIREYWTPPTDARRKLIYHKVTPVEIKILGDEAYDWGYYEGKTKKMEDGSISEWKGKYVIVWKKTKGGEWKIYLDIWNSIPLE